MDSRQRKNRRVKKMRNLRITALIAIFAMVATVSAFGQMLTPTSPTNTSTMGIFTSDVEDSMSVHDYGNLTFEKWAGFAGTQYQSGSNWASLGYATKTGALYLGIWYHGRFLSMNSTVYEDVQSSIDLNNQQLTQTVTTTYFNDDYIRGGNRIHALIGVAGMGIKVGFYENLTTYTNPNGTITVTENKLGNDVTFTSKLLDYSRVEGTMTPSLEWGTKLAVGELAIKPIVSVNFDINQTNTFQKSRPTYTEVSGTRTGNDVVNFSGNNSDWLNPRVLVGADIDLSETTTVGLKYRFGAGIYDKSYNAAGFKGNVTGDITTFSGSSTTATSMATTTTTNNLSLTIRDRASMTHDIFPSFYKETQAGENLKIGFELAVPVSISSSSYTGTADGTISTYIKTFNTVKIVYSDESQKFRNTTVKTETVASSGKVDRTSFNIAPEISVGAVYSLIPNRFSVNAGIGLTVLDYTSTTTNYKRGSNHTKQTVTNYDANNNEISKTVSLTGTPAPTTDTITDRQTINNTWDNLEIRAAAGFTLNFNETMSVDMAAAGGSTSTQFTLDLASVRLLFNFKF